jgi:hypothetical protein
MDPVDLNGRKANIQEVATFLRVALDARLATVDEVVRWADSFVNAEDRPPLWAVELSLCRKWTPQRISDALKALGQESTSDVVRFMLAGRLAGELSRGTVSPRRAMELCWSLPLRRLDGPMDALTQAVYQIDQALEEVEEGWVAEPMVEAEFRVQIAAFSRFDWTAA